MSNGEINLQVTNVFWRNWQAKNAGVEFIVNEGGSRSSKTWSIAQVLILTLLNESNVTLTIARKTFNALKSTAMRDFFQILVELDLYDASKHNKTDNIYYLNGNLIEFIGLDQPQKKRGAKRKYLWMNEANEFDLEDWRQLNIRTEGQIFMDYNPSEISHWIYDEVLIHPNCIVIKSTYKDNPFLNDRLVRELERYRDIDDHFWTIYGLGERSVPTNTIFPYWYEYDVTTTNTFAYGLDFGYNHPTALVKVSFDIYQMKLYWEELLYETKLTNDELINKLIALVPNKHDYIFGDSEDPKTIDAISNAGFNIQPALKGPGSVLESIKYIKGFQLNVHKFSVNLKNELKNYKWKENKKNGEILDEPVKLRDHAIDAGRYATYSFGVNYLSLNGIYVPIGSINHPQYVNNSFRNKLRSIE